MRLTHFYLVNLFGDVPLIISTSFATNSVLPRFDKSQVYQLIIADLKDEKSYCKVIILCLMGENKSK